MVVFGPLRAETRWRFRRLNKNKKKGFDQTMLLLDGDRTMLYHRWCTREKPSKGGYTFGCTNW